MWCDVMWGEVRWGGVRLRSVPPPPAPVVLAGRAGSREIGAARWRYRVASTWSRPGGVKRFQIQSCLVRGLTACTSAEFQYPCLPCYDFDIVASWWLLLCQSTPICHGDWNLVACRPALFNDPPPFRRFWCLMAHSCHWIDHQMEATICSYYSLIILFCLHSRPWPGCLFIWPLYSEYGIHSAPIRRKCTLFFSPHEASPISILM